MPRANRLRLLAFGLLPAFGLAPAPSRAEWVDWIADLELPFSYTDNLGNSAFEAREEDDFSWHPGARAGRVYQLGERTRASATAEVRGEVYHDFDELDAVRGGGRLSIFHKLGLADAPWLRASLFGGYEEVGDDLRSGRRLELSLTAGKRFSPRLEASLAYVFSDRDGESGPAAIPAVGTDVFDQQDHRWVAEGSFLLAEPLVVTAGYAFRYGEFDSASPGCTPGIRSPALAGEDVKAATLDRVFGGCVYRLNGTGHAAFLNLSYGLTDRLSVDASYRFQYARGDELSYERNTAQLTMLFHY